MPIEFKCDQCGAAIVVKFVKPGETAKCRACGAVVPVPEDAVSTNAAPIYGPRPDSSDRAASDPAQAQEDQASAGRMGLTRTAYRDYIEELTTLAEEDPGGYRRRVALLVFKGYGYIVGMLLLFVLAIGTIVSIMVASGSFSIISLKLLVPLAFLALIFLKALWPRMTEPEGAALDENEAPELFAMIDRVRTRLGVPRPYAVLRTADFNASIAQFPAYGFFGGYRSYVVLGLPLLEAITPDEFEAVLAHEFGHLAGHHGKFGATVYRMRQSWGRILVDLEAANSGLDLVRGFLRGFVPEFDATTFVMVRQHEYEADQAAAEATSARTMGSALIRLELMSRARREKLSAALTDRLAREPEPPPDVVGDEVRMVRQGLDAETAREWLKDALAQPTDLDDTHPALADRLAALGVEPESLAVATPLERSAAEAFAGPIRDAWREEINEDWLTANAERWRAESKAVSERRETHAEWKARAESGALSKGEQFAYAVSLLNQEGVDAAIAQLRPWVVAEPGDLRARGMLGDLLLERGDESGLAHLDAVVESEPALAVQSCQRAYQWLFHRGRKQDADNWFEREKRCLAAWERGRYERQSIAASDEFLPHGLSEDTVGPIRDAMTAVEGIEGAWLVRKRLHVIPDEPLWVLFAEPATGRPFLRVDNRAQNILKQMADTVPPLAPSLHVVLMPELATIRPKLEAIESARLG